MMHLLTYIHAVRAFGHLDGQSRTISETEPNNLASAADDESGARAIRSLSREKEIANNPNQLPGETWSNPD